MDKPFKAEVDIDKGVTNLFFKDKPKVGWAFHVRGAIQWPIGLHPGYCLLSGKDILTQELWIFEEYPFWTIGTLKGEPGLWYFLNKVWKKYLARLYYFAKQEGHQRYLIQVHRERLVSQSPAFVEAEYASKNADNVDNLILEYQRLKRLHYEKEPNPQYHKNFTCGNLLDQSVVLAKGFTLDEDSLPAVKALRALVAGIERTPYRKPIKEQLPRESYY